MAGYVFTDSAGTLGDIFAFIFVDELVDDLFGLGGDVIIFEEDVQTPARMWALTRANLHVAEEEIGTGRNL